MALVVMERRYWRAQRSAYAFADIKVDTFDWVFGNHHSIIIVVRGGEIGQQEHYDHIHLNIMPLTW